jgi:hypothetical protein
MKDNILHRAEKPLGIKITQKLLKILMQTNPSWNVITIFQEPSLFGLLGPMSTFQQQNRAPTPRWNYYNLKEKQMRNLNTLHICTLAKLLHLLISGRFQSKRDSLLVSWSRKVRLLTQKRLWVAKTKCLSGIPFIRSRFRKKATTRQNTGSTQMYLLIW